MESGAGSSYDEIPYSDSCFHMSHPDHLATLAAVYGAPVPDLERCRVLELGCARGGNLLPMALELPNATFVGVDLSARQIEEARAVAARLGLSNVELHAMSLTEVDRSFGLFDFVVCHGVYTWVPDRVREKILAICSENLTPSGLAYVSYNTYPGWHQRRILRELMLYHARREDSLVKKVEKARAIPDALARALPNPKSTYGDILRAEAAILEGVTDTYLFHEFLEEVNEPCLVHEFLDSARERGLELLAEASAPGLAATLPAEAQEALARWADDAVSREQYLDFLCDRTFRRSVLRRAGGPSLPGPSADALDRLSVTSPLVPADPDADATDASTVEFLRPQDSGSVTTSNPVGKAALLGLWEARPRALSFEALWDVVRSRLTEGGKALPLPEDAARAALRRTLLQLYLSDLVQLHVRPPAPAFAAAARPLGSPFARFQAESSARVTNLCRRPVTLEEFDRAVLLQLDGTRDQPAVVDVLVGEVLAGRFELSRDGAAVTDASFLRGLFAEGVAESVRRLATLALLAG